MASNEMYRFYAQTRTLLGESASQIFKDLQSLYGSDSPSCTTVFRYVKVPEDSSDFSGASGDSVTNTLSPVGRPVSVSTEENVQ